MGIDEFRSTAYEVALLEVRVPLSEETVCDVMWGEENLEVSH